MNSKRYIIIVLLAAAISSCKKDYSNPSYQGVDNKRKLVRATTIGPLENSLPILATGKVFSKKEILLSFKTGGIVKRLLIEEADRVERGQLLAQLDLSEINAQVISAKNAYEKSQRDLERATNLYRDTVGTLEQKQNAQTAREVARANLDIANFNLEYSQIKSPIRGTVFKRLVEVGELVGPGQPIYEVGSSGSTGSKILRLGIADKEIGMFKIGDSARVRFDAFPQHRYLAKVSEIGQSSNPRTGLFEVEITLNESYPELKNGLIGYIEIFPSNRPKSLKIPMNALVEGADNEAVIYYSTDGETAERTVVQIDAFSGDFFTVSQVDIPDNAMIITEGAPYLQNNDTIKIVQ